MIFSENRFPLFGIMLYVDRQSDPLLVETALMHRIGLAHQDMGGDLVLGAAGLPASPAEQADN